MEYDGEPEKIRRVCTLEGELQPKKGTPERTQRANGIPLQFWLKWLHGVIGATPAAHPDKVLYP